MASALFFLDLKGKVRAPDRAPMPRCPADPQTLLARNYRGDIPMSAVEKFPILLSEAEEESSAVPPCFSHEGINVGPPLPRRLRLADARPSTSTSGTTTSTSSR